MSTVASFALEQYERMVEAGAFDGHLRQRVEFIHGEIRQMNPIGTHHAQVLTDLTDWSYDVAPRNEFTIRVQTTLRMPQLNSAPEPDLVWVRRRSYSQKHPEPADVRLLIEVAESSLAEDRGEKLELYAAAGVSDYWIANVVDRKIEVYRDPAGSTYTTSNIYGAGQSVAPLCLPSRSLAVDFLFPA